jgi:hypothetical protein
MRRYASCWFDFVPEDFGEHAPYSARLLTARKTRRNVISPRYHPPPERPILNGSAEDRVALVAALARSYASQLQGE